MTESTGLDPTLRNRLLRYIYTGNELPKYYPGIWYTNKYFEEDKLTVLNEVFSNEPNNIEVVNIILKACKDGYYTHFGTIAFALAKCLLLGSSNVKEATYNAVGEICVTSEQMLLFNKFTRLLKTGNGRGWCKNVSEWYTSKDPMTLAKEMTRVRGRYGRSHKTLIRKSHVKTPENDFARDAVIKYTIFGLKRAKQLLGDKTEAKAVLDYIQKVEDMRHCEDPVAAAEIAARNKFTLDHVPGHLLTSQDVWNAVLPQFTISEILVNIQRIHNMGFLTNESPTTAIVVSVLNNMRLIEQSTISPIEVYITLCNYKKKSRPLKHEKQKIVLEKEQRRRTRQIFNTKTGLWEWTTNRRHPKEVKYWGIDLPPNQPIIATLNKLMDHSWFLGPPTNARYLISMDMRHHMFKGRHFCKSYTVPKKGKKAAITTTNGATGGGDADTEKPNKKRLLAECFYNHNVTPGHAAIILALHLLRRETYVTIAIFNDESIAEIAIEPNFSTIEEVEYLLRKSNVGLVQLDAPMRWATRRRQQFDVFINMVDRTTRYMELDKNARGGRGPGGRYGPRPSPDKNLDDRCPVRALERYRSNAFGVEDAKLIVMNLASHRVMTTDGSHEGVLDIIGIDEYVPKILDAFVLNKFK